MSHAQHDSGRICSDAYKSNVCKFDLDDGQGYNGNTSHGFNDANGHCASHEPHIQHPSHGPHIQHPSRGSNVKNVHLNVGPNIVPSSNFVQVDQTDPGSPEPICDGLGFGDSSF